MIEFQFRRRGRIVKVFQLKADPESASPESLAADEINPARNRVSVAAQHGVQRNSGHMGQEDRSLVLKYQ
jgi:hypothetical protein